MKLSQYKILYYRFEYTLLKPRKTNVTIAFYACLVGRGLWLFIIINCFIERNSINITFCSKWCTGFRSRSPRHYYGKEERPNTGLAEISLLPAEGNSKAIINY